VSGAIDSVVCLTVDVEWCAPPVLNDLVSLLDERGLKATFFVTHLGVDVPGHERGIHPNYRSSSDVVKSLPEPISDTSIYEGVVKAYKDFAPEARGVRGHSLHYDSLLLSIYQKSGIAYDSSYQMSLMAGITPFLKEYDILEMPIFFNDFYELKSGPTGFDAAKINLDAPGLKVFDIHPNTTYINASSLDHYNSTKSFYKDPDRLLASRHPGAGVRTMVLGLLDRLASGGYTTALMGEVNDAWRSR